MMPEAWASIRSMARWVLPVLVGPRTARTCSQAGRIGEVQEGPDMGGMVGFWRGECKLKFRDVEPGP